MIENVHEHHRQHPSFPCEVAKGLSQTVAGYTANQFNRIGCNTDNAPCLYSAYGNSILSIVGKNKVATPMRDI
jgi:hypothetical protein